MFILKFFLEVSLLVGLFFIFRRFIFKSMHQSKSEGQVPVSTLNRVVYSSIFLLSGFVFSFITFWSVYIAFNIFHSFGHYSGVLVAKQIGLFAPSLIIGFYISTQSSKAVYAHYFGLKALRQLPEFASDSIARGARFSRVFSAMTLIPAIFLLALQFNVYLKIEGDKIYSRQILQEEKVYALGDVVRVAAGNESEFSLQMSNGEVIAVTAYSGNVNAFLDHLDW